MSEPRMATWPASPLAVLTIRCYGLTAIAYGAVTALQDSDRWSGPTYESAVAAAPQVVWGLVLVIAGALILVGSFTALMLVRTVGLLGFATWLISLAFGILDAAGRHPDVAVASSVLLLGFALALCIVARAREQRSP